MIKVLFNKRSFLTLAFTALFLGFLVTCMEVVPGDKLSLEDAYILAKDGYMEMEERDYSSSIINSVLNLFIFIPLISQYFISDYDIAKSYIFCRLSDNSRWFKYKAFQSAVYCLYSAFVYNLVLVVTTALMGFKLKSGAILLKYFVLEVLAHFLILFLIVFANNVACLKFKPNISTLLFMAATIACAVVLCFLKDGELQFNFIIHYFASWHMTVGDNPIYCYFPTWFYYGGIIFVIAAELFAGNLIVKKEDMI